MLLHVAEEHEPRFYPALATLFYTGLRRGELLGLKWEDVDFERRRLHVRRAYVKGSITTPKSGHGRHAAVAPPLASLLMDVLAQRRRESLGFGWAETPEWVFPSETGGPLDQDNFEQLETRSPTGASAGRQAASASLHAPHVREPRARLGQVGALGR